MAVLKCKMCGGDLNVTEGMKVVECEFCGTQQTIPSGDDDKKTNLFNRANHLRLANEFDRAAAIFENIVNEFPNEAEAYWGLVLCKYGIEYVDDPVTGKKIPTCHRTSYDSIFNDVNYSQALDNADSVAQDVYKREADTINNIQKGILDIVKNEEPFDVFICYKESDDSGARTQDSVLAQDLYYQLTKEGFKVFFARITLEGKLGTAYEPYIFAALNSAKVMVVVGTKPEYYNAVWVKNEWSRFLDMMKKDSSKILIPAYKDMDPYDLPDALSMFQAQDMSKLGFMQDLIRGISKLAGKQEAAAAAAPVQQVVAAAPISSNVENLLKRGYLALEDSKWNEADGFFEQVLNENVEEPRAYLGKLMAELKYDKTDKFLKGTRDITENDNYKKALRFSDKSFKASITEYANAFFYNSALEIMKKASNKDMLKCIEYYENAISFFVKANDYKDSHVKKAECQQEINKCKEVSYQKACNILVVPETIEECNIAKSVFERLGKYKDSRQKLKECISTIDTMETYLSACNMAAMGEVYAIEDALYRFRQISGYKDADERAIKCQEEIDAIHKAKKIKFFAIIVSSIVIVLIFTYFTAIKPTIDRNKALEFLANGDYEAAKNTFGNLDKYKKFLGETIQQQIKTSTDGRIVFGVYDSTPIEWIVLARDSEKMLVISADTVGDEAYGNMDSWSGSWLRSDFERFFSRAFSDTPGEQYIMEVEISNDDIGNSWDKTTDDKVFCLSIEEAERYFENDTDRANGKSWWLRTANSDEGYAYVVYSDGQISDYGHSQSESIGVRPAMFIKLTE